MDTQLDEIFVHGIKAYGYHGVLEKENSDGQWFSVDFKLFLPLNSATTSDELSDTIDYSRAAAIAKSCIEARPPFKLIEKLAGTIADKLLSEFPKIKKIEIVVHKPQAPIGLECEDIGVKITRVAAC